MTLDEKVEKYIRKDGCNMDVQMRNNMKEKGVNVRVTVDSEE